LLYDLTVNRLVSDNCPSVSVDRDRGFTDFEEFVALIVLLHYLSITGTTRFSVLGDQLGSDIIDGRTGSGLAAVDCRLTFGFT
jgi:hypothetical protein